MLRILVILCDVKQAGTYSSLLSKITCENKAYYYRKKDVWRLIAITKPYLERKYIYTIYFYANSFGRMSVLFLFYTFNILLVKVSSFKASKSITTRHIIIISHKHNAREVIRVFFCTYFIALDCKCKYFTCRDVWQGALSCSNFIFLCSSNYFNAEVVMISDYDNEIIFIYCTYM